MKKLITTFLFIAFSLPAFAAAPEPAPPTQAETLAQVGDYLNKLTTIEADFLQTGPDGSISGGKFYLARPGKMRWEYDPPVPVLMISDGREFIYYDKDLKQVTHIPLLGSLAGFLARDRITFDDAVKVKGVEHADGVIRITVVQREKPTEGSLELEFVDNPIQLRNMVITDAVRNTTNVSLSNARFGEPLNKKLFQFDDPTLDRKKQRQAPGFSFQQ